MILEKSAPLIIYTTPLCLHFPVKSIPYVFTRLSTFNPKGINETLKIIERDQCEIVVLSAQAEPLELLGSLVTRCEEKSIPYCYVKDSAGLGRACGIKRPILACSVFSSTPLGAGSEKPMGIAGQLCELKDEVENLFYK